MRRREELALHPSFAHILNRGPYPLYELRIISVNKENIGEKGSKEDWDSNWLEKIAKDGA